MRFDERIYEAGSERLLEVIKQVEKNKKSVLLVGHNPGLEEFLYVLTGATDTMPTGTLSKIALGILTAILIFIAAGSLAGYWIGKMRREAEQRKPRLAYTRIDTRGAVV